MLDKVGEELPGLLSGYRGMDNDIISWLPVSGSCHLVPVSELKSCKRNRMRLGGWQVIKIVFNVQSTALVRGESDYDAQVR